MKHPALVRVIPVVAALALRIVCLAQVWNDPILFEPVLEDAAHWERAEAIRDGGFPESDLPEGSFLYPYVIGALTNLTGPRPEAVFFVQILLDLMTVWLLIGLGRSLAGPGAGLAAGLLYAVHPMAAVYAVRLCPVTWATFLFLVTARRLLPAGGSSASPLWPRGLVTGLLIGLGALFIPLPFLALGLIAVASLWKRREAGRIASSLALAAGAAAVTLPCLFHNASLDDGAFTFAWTDGRGYAQATDPDSWGTPWRGSPPSWESSEDLRFRVSPEVGATEIGWGDLERWHIARGTQRVLETPLPTLLTLGRKALLALSRIEAPDPVPMTAVISHWTPRFRWGLWLFPFLLAFFTLDLVRRLRAGTLPPAVAAALLALAADHVLGPYSSAARQIALPWIVLLAGSGIAAVVAASRDATRRRALIPPAVAALLIGAVSAGDLASARAGLLRPDEYLRLLADLKGRGGHHNEAARILRQAVLIAPDNAPAQADLGTALARDSRYEESIQAFRGAVAADSTHAASLLGLANVLKASGGETEAIEPLRSLVRRYPEVPLYHNELGITYMSAGQLQLARHHLETAVTLAPDYRVAINNLGTLSRMEKQLEELVIPPEMSIPPGDPLYDLSRAIGGFVARRDVAGVDSLAAAARRLRPDHILPDVMQGLVRSGAGDFAGALPFFERANERVPGRAFLAQHLAACYVGLGRVEKAVAFLEGALAAATDENNRRLILSYKDDLASSIDSGR